MSDCNYPKLFQAQTPPNEAPQQRWLALILTAVFVVLVVTPGAFHLAYGVRDSDVNRWSEALRSAPAVDAIRVIESDLDKTFVLGQMARTLLTGVPVQALQWQPFEARAGADGFLYYGIDVQVSLSGGFLDRNFGRGARAADALIHFAEQLRRRNIHLLVVPVPAKSSIYPERLNPQYDVSHGPLLNVDHHGLMDRLRRGGVDVLDLSDIFWSQRYSEQGLLYPPTDSHWSHLGTQLGAAQIAQHVRPHLQDVPPARPFTTHLVPRTWQGDLLRMVELEDTSSRHFDIVENHRQVVDENGPLQPGYGAPVLLLGDSYAALFQDNGSGLAQQLIAELGVEVQSAAQVGVKADAIRQPLERDPQLLSNKRVVIMAFSIRLLVCCDWSRTHLAD